MVLASHDLLGIGLYTPREAALYARVNTQLMTRWIFGIASREPVVRAQLGAAQNKEDRTVTFLDLIQALAIRAIRLQRPEVSLAKIRQAVDEAKKKFGVEYPFAMKHRTLLFTRENPESKDANSRNPDDDGKISCEIVLEKDSRHWQITGKNRGNQLIGEIAEVYMTDLTYDSTGLATEFSPFSKDGRKVVLNPKQRLGEPLISGCGYTAMALWEAAKSEGSIEAAATAYGVDRKDVELACSYFDFLRGPVAA